MGRHTGAPSKGAPGEVATGWGSTSFNPYLRSAHLVYVSRLQNHSCTESLRCSTPMSWSQWEGNRWLSDHRTCPCWVCRSHIYWGIEGQRASPRVSCSFRFLGLAYLGDCGVRVLMRVFHGQCRALCSSFTASFLCEALRCCPL